MSIQKLSLYYMREYLFLINLSWSFASGVIILYISDTTSDQPGLISVCHQNELKFSGCIYFLKMYFYTPALFVPMSEPNPVCIYKLRTSQVGSHFRLRGKEE